MKRIIICLSLCLLMTGVFMFSGYKVLRILGTRVTLEDPLQQPTPQPTPVPTPAPKENSSQMQNMIVPGYKNLIVSSQNRQATVNFYNPAENDGVYNMTFEILVGNGDGTYRSVYQSECVHPGEKVEAVYVNEVLEAGQYDDAFVVVQPYYAASGGKTMSAKMHVSISVI